MICQHEERCHEVFLKRAPGTDGLEVFADDPSGDPSNKSSSREKIKDKEKDKDKDKESPLAWGPVADKRSAVSLTVHFHYSTSLTNFFGLSSDGEIC